MRKKEITDREGTRKVAEQLDDCAEAHAVEQILGCASAGLAGLVNLGSSHRFGERKLGIFHHHAAHQRDEKHAENAADHHQHRRFPIGVRRVERGPRAGNHEGGQCEDSAGRHRLADRSGGSREILLENGALAEPENGHADDGRGIRRGDGHAGTKAQVSVGCAEDDAQHKPQQNGPQRELLHLHVVGYKRLMFARFHVRQLVLARFHVGQ